MEGIGNAPRIYFTSVIIDKTHPCTIYTDMSENEPISEQQKIDAEILHIFETVTAKIQPADKGKDANDTMATSEWMSIINDHYPESHYLSSEMYDLLKDKGYKYEMIGNEILWIVKRL